MFVIISEVERGLLQLPSVPEFEPSDVSDSDESDKIEDTVPYQLITDSAETDESVPYNSQLPESVTESYKTDESFPDSAVTVTDESQSERDELDMSQGEQD